MYARVKSSDPAVKARVEKVMHYFLTSVAGSVEHATVTVDDVSDRLGSALKRCHVEVTLVGGDTVELVETQSDLIMATTRAMDRCVRTIRRRQGFQRFPRSA